MAESSSAGLTSASSSGAAEPAPARLQRALREWAAEVPVDGAVLAVAAGERTLYTAALGTLRVGDRLPVASLSKAVTGAAILTLVQEGRLSLDARLGDLLGGVFGRIGEPTDLRWMDITVRQLASHTSGLPGARPDDPLGPAHLAPSP